MPLWKNGVGLDSVKVIVKIITVIVIGIGQRAKFCGMQVKKENQTPASWLDKTKIADTKQI